MDWQAYRADGAPDEPDGGRCAFASTSYAVFRRRAATAVPGSPHHPLATASC